MATLVTKLEAAHQQLAMAVKLYFQDDDMIAVHTLACAAREIYEKHCNKLDLDRAFNYIRRANPDYSSDSDLWNVLNRLRNFFKHPGNSLDETIELGDSDNKMMLFIACHDCAILCREHQPTECWIFNLWFVGTESPQRHKYEEEIEAKAILRCINERFPDLRNSTLEKQKCIGIQMLDDAHTLSMRTCQSKGFLPDMGI